MTTVRFLGDAALCVDAHAGDPFESNRIIHHLAAVLGAAAIPGVRDLVPGMTTLTVHIDPLRTDIRAIDALIAQAGDALGEDRAARRHEVPVQYGGVAGADLDGVARVTGLTPGEVVAAHCRASYRVCFLGFLPGFAYLGPVHESLRMQRRATPRARVPAGAVAIAEEFTGVYPSESPGGWHIIGRTDLALFDITSPRPSRFAPGDLVRFVER